LLYPLETTRSLKVGGSGASGSALAISAGSFDKAQNYAKLPVAHLLSAIFRDEPHSLAYRTWIFGLMPRSSTISLAVLLLFRLGSMALILNGFLY
jgi:hypothetical protein